MSNDRPSAAQPDDSPEDLADQPGSDPVPAGGQDSSGATAEASGGGQAGVDGIGARGGARAPIGPPTVPAYASPAAAHVPLDCAAFEVSTDRLAVRREGGLVLVELCDPVRRNMMGLEMTAAWGRLMSAIARDNEVRAVLVTGRGTAFSSGGNTAWIGADSHEPVSVLRDRMLAYYRTWLGIRELEVPTIAAINGPAIGAGAALALACDLRWAGSSAIMSLPFLRMGMHPGLLATFLAREVGGVAVARDLLLTGRRIEADEMLAMGLVSRVVPDAELPGESLQVGLDIAAAAPVATRLTKVALRDGLADDWAAAMQWEGLAQGVTLATEDLAEGLAARREKRSPRFTGR